MLVSGLLVAASNVKGCPSHLCVLGSLAGSQAAAIVVRVTAESQRWRGWEKVEGRLSGRRGPALQSTHMQLPTATSSVGGTGLLWYGYVCAYLCVRVCLVDQSHMQTHIAVWTSAHVWSYAEPGLGWLGCCWEWRVIRNTYTCDWRLTQYWMLA